MAGERGNTRAGAAARVLTLALAVLVLSGCTAAASPAPASPSTGMLPTLLSTAPTVSPATAPTARSAASPRTAPHISPTAPSTALPETSRSATRAVRPSSTPTTGPVGPTVSDPVALPGIGTEASGLARSDTIPGAYWVIDDATGTDVVVAVDRRTGRTRGEVAVDGMDPGNAEALTGAACPQELGPGRCLYVGDIGDNAERRDSVAVSALVEPAAGDTTAVAEQWDFAYPDGPHNAESLMVTDDHIVVVTKPAGGTADHRIYVGPLGGGALTLARTFRPPDPPDPLQSMVTGVVASDADWDGTRVLLLTYDDVIAYTAPQPGADPANFPSWPATHLPFPDLPQAEGITSAADTCGYAVVSEDGPLGATSSLAEISCS